jgi:hypothetical protein
LKLVADQSGRVGNDVAVIRACGIDASDWTPARGVPFEREPKWSEPCVGGVRQPDGSWKWDLGQFGNPGKHAGFVLTALAGDRATAFSLVFEPKTASS